MKKLIIILILLLVAAGCTSNNAEDTTNAKLSSEQDTAYFEYDGKQYTKNEVFQRLKSQSVESLFESLIAKKALESENYDFDSKKTEYEEQYDMMASMYGEDLLKQYYGEKDEYVKQASLGDATNLYINNYVEVRLDSFIEKYPSQYVEYIKTENEEKAKKFQKLVAKGSTFEEAKTEVEFENSESVTTEVIATDIASFPDQVNDVIKTLEVGKVSDVIVDVEEILEAANTTSTETTEEEKEPETVTSYYIFRIISQDPKNEYKDEFIAYTIQKEAITSIFQIFSEDHTINFYDDDFVYTYNKLAKPYVQNTEVEE